MVSTSVSTRTIGLVSCIVAGVTAWGSASAIAGSDPSEACRTEEIAPGKEWTSPDGTKSVKNEGKVSIYLYSFKDEDGHYWYRCALPLKAAARIKGFNGGDPNKKYDADAIDVGKGNAELDDCNETNISIDGGTADCDDCDQNDVGFGEDGGKISGDGNDGNSIRNSRQTDVDVSGFKGKKNQYL